MSLPHMLHWNILLTAFNIMQTSKHFIETSLLQTAFKTLRVVAPDTLTEFIYFKALYEM